MTASHHPGNHEQISRREAMRRGVCGAAGMIAAGSVASRVLAAPAEKTPEQVAAELKKTRDEAAKAKAKAKKVQTKSVIQVFLWGGMSHNDTWDPKPGTGYDYLGEFDKFIPTNVNGIQLGALLPNLAKQADKYSLIRSMTHGNNGHETAAYLMQTGHLPGGRLAYPAVGAIFTFFKKDQYKGLLPPYVVMLEAAGRFSEEGFLGPAYKPFATGGDPNAPRFEVQGIVNRGIDDGRQKARRELVDKVNLFGYGLADVPEMAAAETARQNAYGLILGKGREVFNLESEPTELRDRYGRNTFGQECLAARRMVEAGVPYITISFPGGWDTHSNHFATMRNQCASLDQGLATLLGDLKDRGLLESTLVWCTGEFGRTPKVSWEPPWNGGRHHHGDVFTVLVAGGGFVGGRVVGSSDEKGEKVKERPVYPADLLGSMYLLAGIDASAKLPHPWGLDAYVLDTENEGMKAAGLLEELM
ncbi:MAG TPA: DUF1501 domain-containing protein [Phycisphaerae bacterium]|nr:DUF1501 domain-containing protein [Phycisphaerae bacterium]HRY70067.1 DUF1501 domain-containing protein [Phycisphaerae bacterium]HSA27343.1 DUF1501 domain-containing protein [Phycisphaerae bacterium]